MRPIRIPVLVDFMCPVSDDQHLIVISGGLENAETIREFDFSGIYLFPDPKYVNAVSPRCTAVKICFSRRAGGPSRQLKYVSKAGSSEQKDLCIDTSVFDIDLYEGEISLVEFEQYQAISDSGESVKPSTSSENMVKSIDKAITWECVFSFEFPVGCLNKNQVFKDADKALLMVSSIICHAVATTPDKILGDELPYSIYAIPIAVILRKEALRGQVNDEDPLVQLAELTNDDHRFTCYGGFEITNLYSNVPNKAPVHKIEYNSLLIVTNQTF